MKTWLDNHIERYKKNDEFTAETCLLDLTEQLAKMNKQTWLFKLKIWIIETIASNLIYQNRSEICQ